MSKYKKKGMSKIAELTPKQQVFVQEVAQGKTSIEATKAAYAIAPHNVSTYASELMAKPKIREAIAEIIQERFPSLKSSAVKALQRIVEGDETLSIPCTCPKCGEAFNTQINSTPSKDSDVLKAIDLVAKFTGDYAPTKSAKLNVNLDKYRLPEE